MSYLKFNTNVVVPDEIPKFNRTPPPPRLPLVKIEKQYPCSSKCFPFDEIVRVFSIFQNANPFFRYIEWLLFFRRTLYIRLTHVMMLRQNSVYLMPLICFSSFSAAWPKVFAIFLNPSRYGKQIVMQNGHNIKRVDKVSVV